ncbi:MAG: tRNA threonylcarbamoyladenosine dehydratase [Firmicutes bacterium]|nr:tRNA threonylcarbamoyladenosine dehydratase [Bacillota bacterium]
MNERTISLIGENNLEKIRTKKILIVGIGGVGGICLETLVRSGFLNITIIDGDKFSESNLNRQIISNRTNINKSKVKEALKKYKNINSELNLEIKDIFLNEDLNELENYDYIIDAIDEIKVKVSLIKYALKNKIKIISCLGTGKKLNPTLLEITSLNKTYNDPIAKIMRKELKAYDLKKINVVFSKELPKKGSVSSMMMVPATAGIYLAYFVINDIIKKSYS